MNPAETAEQEPTARKPRVDAARNRERLLAAAKGVFATNGAEVALEEIARTAGVGIGTLYRHFPTRAALLAAVYRREVDQLCESASDLLAERPADEALAAWLNVLIDYMATKRIIAPALQGTPDGAQTYAQAGSVIAQCLKLLSGAAIASGGLRQDVTPDDLFRMMMGISYGYEQPGWEHSARRMVEVMMAGLRA